jgi:ATP-dependent RNA helicase DDX5/DBP2
MFVNNNLTPFFIQRAGMKGTSYTYFTTENAKSARDLVAILKEAKATVPPALEEMTMFGGGGGGRSKL